MRGCFLWGQNHLKTLASNLIRRTVALLLSVAICSFCLPRVKANPLAALAGGSVVAPYLIVLVLAAAGIYIYADEFADMSWTLAKSYQDFERDATVVNPVPWADLVGSAAQGGVAIGKAVYNSLTAFARWFIDKYNVRNSVVSQSVTVVEGVKRASAYSFSDTNPSVTRRRESDNYLYWMVANATAVNGNSPTIYSFAFLNNGEYHLAYYAPNLPTGTFHVGCHYTSSGGGWDANGRDISLINTHVWFYSVSGGYWSYAVSTQGYTTTLNAEIPLLSVGGATASEIEAAAVEYFGSNAVTENLTVDTGNISVPADIPVDAVGEDNIRGITVPGTNSGVISSDVIRGIVEDLVTSRELPDEKIGVTDITVTGDVEIADDGTIVTDESVTIGSSSLPVDSTAFAVSGLERYFPFGVPFQARRVLQAFVATPETPILDFRLNFGFGIPEQTIHVDLTEFNSVAEVCRYMFFLEYAVSLMNWLFSVFVG